ncbi:hypothetical protein DPEC_G00018860 [Dallia pectoralis]|uniref:Uncharacterized protein n=1 Tax=Dallia pectoralis TaxID=75939 RepID=A0ACC2HGD7_DALPE|nr:hypothetical protein DPEC_G00018860 [Dallia pectoralis]
MFINTVVCIRFEGSYRVNDTIDASKDIVYCLHPLVSAARIKCVVVRSSQNPFNRYWTTKSATESRRFTIRQVPISADGPDLTDTPVAHLTVVTDDSTDAALFSPESICIVVELIIEAYTKVGVLAHPNRCFASWA